MGSIWKREAAKRDLVEIWVWYAENGGTEVADRFLAASEFTLQTLSTHPEMGFSLILRSAELQGMRRFPVSDGFERILLFYFPLPTGVDLVRVVHGSRDLDQLLQEGFLG